jgi:hypothetical protein
MALLPAVERYESERIRRIYAAALSVGAGFYILSGEYGLLAPQEPIPYYDHLLVEAEVAEMVATLTRQMQSSGIKQIIFFTVSLADDPLLKPYHAALHQACAQANVTLAVVEISFA